jgi:thiol peroxidase
MSKITLKGKPIETGGELPQVKTAAPDFTLTKTDLSDVSLGSYKGKRIILNIFPSIDTDVCAASARRFNEEVNRLNNAVVLCISADLPFAHKRFCEAEGLENIIPLSVFRSSEFGIDYGVTITSGPLADLLSRAILIIDEEGEVTYTEQVPEIAQESDYDAALKAVSA